MLIAANTLHDLFFYALRKDGIEDFEVTVGRYMVLYVMAELIQKYLDEEKKPHIVVYNKDDHEWEEEKLSLTKSDKRYIKENLEQISRLVEEICEGMIGEFSDDWHEWGVRLAPVKPDLFKTMDVFEDSALKLDLRHYAQECVIQCTDLRYAKNFHEYTNSVLDEFLSNGRPIENGVTYAAMLVKSRGPA